MRRGSLSQVLLVIVVGLAVMAAWTVVALSLFGLTHFLLGSVLTTILVVGIALWQTRRWWASQREKQQARATDNEIEYLEELADEHQRGVRDHGDGLRHLLPLFERDAKDLARYKHRIERIRDLLESDTLSKEALAKLKSQVQPEINRSRAEHAGIMRLISRMPAPSEADKKAIAKMNTPESVQKVIKQLTEEPKPPKNA